MRDVVMRELGGAARAYIREHLTDVNVFCTALLRTFMETPGDVFTLVPAGVPEARLAQFDRGGLLEEDWSGAVTLPDGSTLVPKPSLIEAQASLLRQTMIALKASVCVADDFNPRWSDDACPGLAAFGVGEEVYHLLNLDHSKEDFVTVVSLANQIWHGVAAVCRQPVALDLASETTTLEIQRCAASALLITCTAYDGEGFVAWRRTSP
ncbi:MAG: hypothetical protein ABL957_04045 [Parvularculaceae bacterium]